MKYGRVLFLPLVIGGCISASPEHEGSGPPANAESCPQSDFAGKAPSLERYPPVDLRSDLGESMIDCERQLVLASMKAVEEVIQRRAKDKNNIGRGDHAKPLGCYKAEFTVSSANVVRVDDRVDLGQTVD